MKNKIKFIAKDEYALDVVDKPFPASQSIPKWWKEMKPYLSDPEAPNGEKIIVRHGFSNASPKKCVAMLDSITSGYIIPLWADVQIRSVSDSEYLPEIYWRVTKEVFVANSNQGSEMVKAPLGYSSHAYKFQNQWLITTPKGYSINVTPPVGSDSDVFSAIPAVVDTDKHRAGLFFPVWIKEGFEGIIERGTPIVQVTPFKREEWVSEFTSLKDNEYRKIEDKHLNTNIIGKYVKEHWTKKIYR